MADRYLKPFAFLSRLCVGGLKYAGLWALGEENSRGMLPYVYLTYKALMIAIMVAFAGTIVAKICRSMDELSIATDCGCILAGMSVIIFKTMIFQFRRRYILQLLEEAMKSCGDICQFSNTDIGSIVKEYTMRIQVSSYGFSALGFLLVIALIVAAPYGATGLPVNADYPFDIQAWPGHQVAFAAQVIAICTGMNAIVCIDSVASIVCNLLIMQFEVLNANFENCRTSHGYSGQGLDMFTASNGFTGTRNRKNMSNGDFTGRYKLCLQFHRRLTVIITKFNEEFSSGMFVQMVASTSMICLTGFQTIAVGGESSSVLKYGIYLVAAVSQLFYICWIGNELTFASSLIERSQWLSGWNQEPLGDVAQLLNLSTIFSRQPYTLHAGRFYTLSLQTFITIMRGSYSFFTLLNNMRSPVDQ